MHYLLGKRKSNQNIIFEAKRIKHSQSTCAKRCLSMNNPSIDKQKMPKLDDIAGLGSSEIYVEHCKEPVEYFTLFPIQEQTPGNLNLLDL